MSKENTNDFARLREGVDAAKLEYISEKGREYFNQMMQAQREGKGLEDVMDVAGLDALRRFTAAAQKGVTADGATSNRMVPTVTEVENGRERGYDLFSLLMKQRVVLLEGQVDDAMASIACASLLYLKSEASGRPDDPITVHVNSPGGSVLAGLAIYDTMRSIKPEITTIGYGMQASMGSILLVAGDHRKMTRNSKYMIHQPLSGGGERTQQTDILLNADLITRLREDLTDIYVRHTGLNHKYWDIVLERDTWLTAEQAKKMGVIEEIIVGDRKKTLHEEFSTNSAKRDDRAAKVPKTANEIKNVINTAEGSMIRPELVTALSQFEEFWTPSRKALEAKKAAAASNDNKTTAPAASAPKSNGSML
ncbi:MAG: ClpP family protease [Alphaproteobacteria bacterium]